MRHPNELRSIIVECMIEGERTAGRPKNFYVGQIKNYALEDPKKKGEQ